MSCTASMPRLLLLYYLFAVALFVEALDVPHQTSIPSRNRGSIVRTPLRHQRDLHFFYNQKYRARDLWKAIDDEDLDTFERIMNCSCINLEETDDTTGFTALRRAANKRNYVMALDLVKSGANVNAQSNIGVGPLHVSCFLHDRKITELLLENGAEVNLRSVTNERPIIHAQTENDVPLLELLVRSGAEINFQDAEGETPLHEASAYGATENVRFLIERGANVSVREQNGRTPAEFICNCLSIDERLAAPCFDGTCTEKDIRAIKRVFQEADRNRRSAEDNATTVEDLWLAIVRRSVKDVTSILETGSIEIQAVTQSQTGDWDEGQSALHLAILTGNIKICEILLENGARPAARNAIGNTPLHLATESNSVPLVQRILDQNVTINAQNDAGQTALHIASFNGLTEVARLLVSAGASQDVHDNEGATAEEIFCTCLLEETCHKGTCSSTTDLFHLMEVLNVTDSRTQEQYNQLYFQNAGGGDPNAPSMDRLPDDDDGASSLGLFVGLLFSFAFMFFVIYGIAVCRMQQPNNSNRVQMMNNPRRSRRRAII